MNPESPENRTTLVLGKDTGNEPKTLVDKKKLTGCTVFVLLVALSIFFILYIIYRSHDAWYIPVLMFIVAFIIAFLFSHLKHLKKYGGERRK
jgi:4-hydroxybenzoate polyprenyltransferase